jgi:type II secretory pathway component GspD/PulD (secretin)
MKMMKLSVFMLVAKLSVVGAFIYAGSSYAKDGCTDIESCLKSASKITGYNYIYGKKVKGQISGSDAIVFNKKNVNNILGAVLNELGYSRVRIDANNYRIINNRDTRYNPAHQVDASKKQAPMLDPRVDYHQMIYQLQKNSDPNMIARNLRPFMSRYGRIVDMDSSNLLIISDRTSGLKKIYELIKKADIPLSKVELKDKRNRLEHRRKLKLAEAGNCQKYKDKLFESKRRDK